MVKHFPHVSPLLLCIVAFALLCFGYVWQMTVMSMRSYVRNDLTRQRSTLFDTIERASIETLEHQSLARVEARLQEAQLVRDAKVEYVTREDIRVSVSAR